MQRGTPIKWHVAATDPQTGAAFGQFLLSLWPLAVGTVFHAASSACLALRDIARNSFADRGVG